MASRTEINGAGAKLVRNRKERPIFETGSGHSASSWSPSRKTRSPPLSRTADRRAASTLPFNNRPVAVWKGISGDQGMYFSTYDGSSWQPQKSHCRRRYQPLSGLAASRFACTWCGSVLATTSVSITQAITARTGRRSAKSRISAVATHPRSPRRPHGCSWPGLGSAGDLGADR